LLMAHFYLLTKNFKNQKSWGKGRASANSWLGIR
jgi:hypothetical protein